jgi:hypothetical protein
MYVEDVTSIVGTQFLGIIGFEQGYGIRRLYQCEMGHSELWPTSYSRQGCAWNGACNVPSRMLWPTSFEGPC